MPYSKIKLYAVIQLLLFSCLSFRIAAVEVADLYLVKTPIAEQSKTALWKASLGGFKEVLIRKSGSRDILQSYEVQNAYSRVTSYLQRFKYSNQTDSSVEESYIIELHFEPRLIDSLIQESKMTVWGINRPVTILWLVVQDQNGRNIVRESIESSELEKLITANATRRGVPVILPLMDLEDEMLVSMSDIWGRFPTTIREASKRYDADSVLYGRIRQDGAGWVGQFGYVDDSEQQIFEVVEDNKENIINSLTDRLADTLCAKYCIVEQEGKKQEVFLELSDVTSFKQFKLAESYLNGLSSIRRVELIAIDGQKANFKLTLLGQLESVIEGIGLNQKMVAREQTENSKPSQDDESDLNGSGQNLPTNQDDLTAEDNNDLTDTSPDSKVDSEQESKQNVQTLFYRWIG
jgi:hypothetical protein